MKVHVQRGRIHVTEWSHDINLANDERDRVLAAIPSARLQRDGTTITTALSIENFKKLKAVGAKLAKDSTTDAAVKRMLAEQAQYQQESAMVIDVKDRGWCYFDDTYPKIEYKFKSPPYTHQVSGFHFLHALPNAALFGDCGSGKAVAISAPCLTPDGWKPIKDVRVGDWVIARDGKPYPVIGVFPQGKRQLYRISFSDGASILADDNHLWVVQSKDDSDRDRWRIRSTKTLRRDPLSYGSTKSSFKWRIPTVCPVAFSTKEHNILSPYLLGAIIATGGVPEKNRVIRWTKADPRFADELAKELPSGHVLRRTPGKAENRVYLTLVSIPHNAPNLVTRELDKHGILGCPLQDKHIPKDYLLGDANQRLALLQGIFDAGKLRSAKITYITASAQMAQDVAFLVESLGGRANVTSTQPFRMLDGKKVPAMRAHHVYLRLPVGTPPFRAKRDLVTATCPRQIRRSITAIEPATEEEAVCISVASPDRTYVCERFIVTHNTFMALTFAESLILAEPENNWRFIVLCPVNLIYHVWQVDAEKFTNLSTESLRDDRVVRRLASDFDEGVDRTDPEEKKKARRRVAARRRKLLDTKFDEADANIYVLNYENIRTDPKEARLKRLMQRLTNEGKQIALILDESSVLASRTSRTYKAIKRLRPLCSRCVIMSGTPTPNGILGLWSQFDILDGGQTLQPSYIDFRGDTHTERARRGVTYVDKQGNRRNVLEWAPKPSAAKNIHRRIYPRMIRFRTEDCIDLPPQRCIVRPVNMSADQAEIYDDMETRLLAEVDGQPITAKVAATKLIKLRQITGGFVRDDDGKEHAICKVPPKALETDFLLAQSIAPQLDPDDTAPRKAIIWGQARWEVRMLTDRYKRSYGARALFGGISAKQKQINISLFKEDPSCRLLVCHPGAAGHGLTLVEANVAIYYSLGDNFEHMYQSYRRITRPGQKRAMTFYLLVTPSTVDAYLLNLIRRKKSLSDVVADGGFSRDGFLREREIPQQIDLFDVPTVG